MKLRLAIDDIDEIIRLYKDMKSTKFISKIYNCSPYHILSILKKNNITLRYSNRKYQVNQVFFKQIDSSEKAQILGFIAADGCVYKNQLIISISDADRDYLNKIKEIMDYTGDVKINEQRGAFKSENKIARLLISDKYLINDLKNLGISERKSLFLEFPNENNIPNYFINSYILGYLEGDGCITIDEKRKSVRVQICGTEQFLNKLKEVIYKNLNISSSIYQTKHCKEKLVNMKFLVVAGNQNVLKFLNWIYKDCIFKMQRKYDKISKIKNLYVSEKIKFRPIRSHNYENAL